ncbi:MAG: tetratricopeptide repeat protein [Deltaproteobacteria bacterium]|nr:tetratricopeptide repeat protein [Deltaproteobacteria bacterium]
MDAARKFVDKGQIDKAVKEYLRIVNEDPKDVRVWLKIGDLYAKKGEKQNATETYLKVARFYHEQGFFLKAVAVYKQILKLDPRLVDVILKLAELYKQLGLMSDAMQHFESVAAHFHREGNTKEALATVKKLVDLDPENIATRIKLAELYSKEGLVEEAATEFTVACEQLRRQNRQDDFVKVAERLLWHKPDNHALNRELAGLYLRRNDPRRALQKLQACFKADPRDVETLGLLAQAFQALDQKAKTVSVLKELARVHVENKHRDKATEVYRKILEFVPTDPDAKDFLGTASAPVKPVAAVAPPPPRPASPPPRPQTPMPDQVRASTGAAKFNITGDIPSYQSAPPSANMTGSMPLVDEQSLSGVDFALPEYDDADFSADMEPAPDPRAMSAAGERHAEEISKILAETDVYVKYGLHQKAVDHLRRVFTLDPENVEAHERLKDIFVSQGREQEAEVELLKLAEVVASSDPDRAEAYLQELLAMNGTHTGAFELARRFRLRVARMSSVSAEVEYSGGGVAAVDADLDDLSLDDAPRSHARPMGVARGAGGPRDSIDDFDPDDLISGRVAHGSPAPGRPPQPPQYEDAYGGEFAEHQDPSQSTRQMSPEHAEALANIEGDDELDDPVIVDGPPPPHWGNDPYGQQATYQAVDAQLDDDALSQDIDSEVAAELAGNDLSFDPDDARSFDAGLDRDPQGGTSPNSYVSGFDDTEAPQRPTQQQVDTNSHDYVDESLAVSGSYDPYGTEAVQTPPYDPTAAHVVDTSQEELADPDADPLAEQPRAESLVEDDLDEADFYSSQGMYQEALDVLGVLIQRYPNHRLILAKLREVEALAGVATSHEDVPSDAIDIDEIEEVQADELEEIDSQVHAPPVKAGKRVPTVMLERPVDESDAETHYDLGLAYKEMGLMDEAIKAFEKALRAPGREVGCRVMIGMCLRDQGNPSEAVHQFKAGLHAEPTDRERQSIYYEIGQTYEAIGDVGEALYYFEMVAKRDPQFADAGARVQNLRAQGTRPQHADDDI